MAKEKYIYNMDSLVKVVVEDYTRAKWYKYNPEHKIFGLFKVDAYIKEAIGPMYTIPEFMALKYKSLVIQDNKVMHKPHVTLHFSNDHRHGETFETYEEAKRWAKEHTDHLENKYEKNY